MAISVICAIVKNEQRFIREWAEHYLNLGFDKLYIYEDYGSDSHKEQLQDLDKVELVHLDGSNLPIPQRGIISKGGMSTQKVLYKWFLKECKKGKIIADWIGFFDVDEFLMFEDGWNLENLEEEFKNFGGIILSWKLFGANGHMKRPEGGVVDNYINPLPDGFLLDKFVRINVKSLVNVKNCPGLKSIHVFKNCIMTDGKPILKDLCFEKAWLNHYYSKSWEDYLNRIFARGNMLNNFRSLDQFFKANPDMKYKEKEMIISLRYKHTASTMWISRKYKIISGGNIERLENLRKKLIK